MMMVKVVATGGTGLIVLEIQSPHMVSNITFLTCSLSHTHTWAARPQGMSFCLCYSGHAPPRFPVFLLLFLLYFLFFWQCFFWLVSRDCDDDGVMVTGSAVVSFFFKIILMFSKVFYGERETFTPYSGTFSTEGPGPRSWDITIALEDTPGQAVGGGGKGWRQGRGMLYGSDVGGSPVEPAN